MGKAKMMVRAQPTMVSFAEGTIREMCNHNLLSY